MWPEEIEERADGVFAPAGLEPVVVAPGTTQPVTLTTLLDDAVAQGAIGLLLESTGPVVANLRQLAGEQPRSWPGPV